MYGRKSKIASSRRLKAPFAHGDAYAQQQAAAHAAQQAATGSDRHGLPKRPSTAVAPQLQHNKSSKAQALAAFHGLVESASKARLALPLPGAPVGTAEAEAAAVDDNAAAHRPEHFECPQGQRQKCTDPDKITKHAAEPATADAAPQARQLLSATAGQQHPNQPQSAVPLAAAQPNRPAQPTQLLPRAASALKKLQQQLSSRTLTYLYQFDSLLRQAFAAVTAVASFLTSDGSEEGSAEPLQQLVQEGCHQAQQHDTVRAADALLGLCRSSWDVIMLLLQHHHAAEPANTATQAREIHGAVRILWDVYEAAPQGCLTTAVTATEYSGQQDGDKEASMSEFLLKDALVQALATLAQVAGHWPSISDSETSDWCYLQLRKHLFNISKASADSRLAVAERRELQQLQMNILQGNIAMVAREGQQVLWTNLTNMLQQLLSVSLMDPEDTISLCLTLAGTLAEQAKQITSPASSSSSSSIGHEAAEPKRTPTLPAKFSNKCSDKEAVSNACRMLEYAVELLEYCSSQVDTLQQQQQGLEATVVCQAEATGQHMTVVKHILGIQQQVLLQLGQAYLISKQYSKATDCVNRLRGISTGQTPPQGLIQLSILALVGQGKHMPACAQLCAWLKQSAVTSSITTSGSSSTVQEACAAVVAFLQALHGSSCDAGSVAEVIEMVADAAAQRGGGDGAVAVAVIKELLSTEVCGDAQHQSLEQLVVKLLGREEAVQLIMKNPTDAKYCHTLLHQHAQLHYSVHNYTAAIQLLTPAVFFSTTVTSGRSARLLAMCLLKCQQPQRAVDYVSLAEQQEGQTTALGCLIRLQALLLLAEPATAVERARIPGAAAAADSSNDAERVKDEEITAAVHMLSSCVDFDSQPAQAAFSLCMQARQPRAAWEVLKTWDRTPPVFKPAATAAAGAGSDSNKRSLQTLVFMANLYLRERHQLLSSANSSGSAAAAAAAVGSDLLADLCSLYCRCVAQLKLAKHVSTPAAAAAVAVAAGVTAGTAGEQDVCCFDEKQLMWLVDVGMQLGIEAIKQGLLDLGTQFMQGASTCCTALQQQQQQQVAAKRSQQADALDASDVSINHNDSSSSRGHNSATVTAVAAVCRRQLCAQATAITLLLSDTDSTAANQQQQPLKHARQLLDLAQQQLLLLQQVETASAPASPPAASEADSITIGSSNLLYQFSKIAFTVACGEGDEQCMKQCLQQMVQSPHARASDLEAAAYDCIRPLAVHRSETVAALAYGYMLRMATAAVDTVVDNPAAAAAVDLAAVAAAVMGMMGLVTSHGVRIKVCSKVAITLATIHQQQQCGNGSSSSSGESAFPAEILQWLIITCWNAAAQLSSSNAATAVQYLNCAAALSAAQQSSYAITAGDTHDTAAAGVGAVVAADATSLTKQQQQQQHHWLLTSRHYKALKANLAAQLVYDDSSVVEAQPPQAPMAAAATAAADVTSLHDQHDQDDQQLPDETFPLAAQDVCQPPSPSLLRSDQPVAAKAAPYSADQDDHLLPNEAVPAAARDLHEPLLPSLITDQPLSATTADTADQCDKPLHHGHVQIVAQIADKPLSLAINQTGLHQMHDPYLDHPAAAAAVATQSSMLAQASESLGVHQNDTATQQEQQLQHQSQLQLHSQDAVVAERPSTHQSVQPDKEAGSSISQQPTTVAPQGQQPATQQLQQQQLEQSEQELGCQQINLGEGPSSQHSMQPKEANNPVVQRPIGANHKQQQGKPECQIAAVDASANLSQQRRSAESADDEPRDTQCMRVVAKTQQQQQLPEGLRQVQQSQQQHQQSQQQQQQQRHSRQQQRQFQQQLRQSQQQQSYQHQQHHCEAGTQHQLGQQRQRHLKPAETSCLQLTPPPPLQQQQQGSRASQGHAEVLKASSSGRSHEEDNDDVAIMQRSQHSNHRTIELHQLHSSAPHGGTTCPLSSQQQQQQVFDDMLPQIESQAPQSPPPAAAAAAAAAGSLDDGGTTEAKLQHTIPAAAAAAATDPVTSALPSAVAMANVPQASPAGAAPALLASIEASASGQRIGAGVGFDCKDCNMVMINAEKPVVESQSAAAAAQENADQVGAEYDNIAGLLTGGQATAAAAVDVASLPIIESTVEFQAAGRLQLATAAAAAKRCQIRSQHGGAQLDSDEYADHDVVMATPEDDRTADGDANVGQLQDLMTVDHNTTAAAAAAGPMAFGDQVTRAAAAAAATAAAELDQAHEVMAVNDDMAAPIAAQASDSPATAAATAGADGYQAHETIAVRIAHKMMAVDDAWEAAPVAAVASDDPATACDLAAATDVRIDQSQEEKEVDRVVLEAPAAIAASENFTTVVAQAAADKAQDAMTVDDVESPAAAAPAASGLTIRASTIAAAAVDVTSEQHGGGAIVGDNTAAAAAAANVAEFELDSMAVARHLAGPGLNDQQHISSLQLLMGSPCDSRVESLYLGIGAGGTAAAAAAAAAGQDGTQGAVDVCMTTARPAANAKLTRDGVAFAVCGLNGGSSAEAAVEFEEDDAAFTQGLQLVLSNGSNVE